MEVISRSARLGAAMELIAILGTFLAVRQYMAGQDILGAGSIAVLSAVAVGTALMKLRGRSWAELGFTLPKGATGWIITLVLTALTMGAVVLGMTYVVVPALTKFMPGSSFGGGEHFDFLIGEPMVFVTYLILVGWIGAAFGEEMFTRGLMMNNLAELLGATRAAWILALFGQAIFFGLAHAYQGPGGMVLTGSIGFIFGIFYLIGGRKLAHLILAHGLIDTISLYQIYASGGLPAH